jgi:hypothetical protein
MEIKVRACKCEKVPEAEFDRNPELNEGWVVLERKDGFVYVGYRYREDASWSTTEDEILELQKNGHTFHCAMRILTGDGECECGKRNHIPGGISRGMYSGRCLVCLAPEGNEHKDWCRNRED